MNKLPTRITLCRISRGVAALWLLSLAAVSAAPAAKPAPPPAWRIAIGTPFPGGIAFIDEGGITISVRVGNNTGTLVEGELRCRVADYDGREVAAKSLAGRFGRDETLLELKVPGGTPGFFGVDAEVTAGGKRLASAEGGVAVVVRPRNLGRDDDQAFFAIHGSSAGCERIGAKWVRRFHDWQWLEQRPGEYRWYDESAKEARANHMKVMMAVTDRLPKWAQGMVPEGQLWTTNETLVKAYENLWRNYVRHFRDLVDVYDVVNEPDLACWRRMGVSPEAGAEHYARMVKIAAAVIREEAPRARIAAVSVSGSGYDGGLPFTRAALQRTIGLFDIFAGHPYASPRYFGEGLNPRFPHENRDAEKVRLSQKLLAEFGGKQPVWIGEKGWALSLKEPALGAQSRAFANCAAQGLVTLRAVPGVERYFWFCSRGCLEQGCEYGFWRGDPLQPLPAAVAYATTARFLEHARPHRDLKLAEELRGFSFDSPDLHSGVVALWSVGEEMKLSAPWPAGTRAYDLMGREIAAQALPLGQSPLFITTPAGQLDALCAAVEKAPAAAARPLRLETLYVPATDRLVARLANRTGEVLAAEVRAAGGSAAVKLPADGTPVEVALAPRGGLLPLNGKKVDVAVLAGGAPVLTRSLSLDLAPCPRRTVPVGSPLSEWGAPALSLKERGRILPPDPNIGWSGPDDLSADAWYGYDAQSFYLAVRVHDDVHHPESVGTGGFYKGDSLQVAFDTANDAADAGYDKNDVELGCALGPDGAWVGRTYPDPAPLKIPCDCRREGQETIYRLAIPWKLLGVTPRRGTVFSFNFIVNDNDGSGRDYWMGPRPGIGDGKRPGSFLDLFLE